MQPDAARALLGVTTTANEEQIKRAWRELALQWHPDKNSNEDAANKFRDVTDAYKLLSRGEDACKGYEELAAENEKAREALSRAMDLAARFEQRLEASRSAPPSDSKQTVMQVGAATWVGEVEGGRPHGSGDLILPNGAVHHGLFEAGRACGAGVLYEASGAVMHGSWADNRRVGAFRTVDPKGGLWDDVYDEQGKRVSRKKAPPPGASTAYAAASAAAAAAASTASPAAAAAVPPAAAAAVPPAAGAVAASAALACRHCGVKFHAEHNYRCRQHSGTWVDASRYNADGSAALVDSVAFPEGGLWLCCGSKARAGGERCTLGLHASEEAAPLPETMRIGAAADLAEPETDS